MAVYVTKVFGQTGFAEARIKTLTGKFPLTVIVITLEVAGLPDRRKDLKSSLL